MHPVFLLLGSVLLAVYAPALMPDSPSPWFYLLFPWFIYFLYVVLKKAIIYGYFDFLDDRNLVEGKEDPLGNSRLTPEQKGWIWLKETRLGATLSLNDPD